MKVNLVCVLASYLVAFGLEFSRIARRSGARQLVMWLFAAAGFVAHSWLLLQNSRDAELPLLSSSQDWILVLTWLAMLVFLFLAGLDRDVSIGLFLLPAVLVLVAASSFVSTGPVRLQDAGRNWVVLHVSSLAFGTCAVLLGFVLSLMYLVQHRRLKRRRALQAGLVLPSLERLSRWNRYSVIVSVPLLTLGLGIGVGLGVSASQTLSATDPLVLVSGITWLALIAVFVWMLKTRRPSGKQVAWRTCLAFGFLLLAMIVVLIGMPGGEDDSVHPRTSRLADETNGK